MTKKQVYKQLCEFLKDWKRAQRFVEILDHNICVSFRQVTSIQMCWGKYSDLNGNYYGENHDTVNFSYTDTDRERHFFSIME